MKIVADSHIPFVQDYFGSYGDLVLVPGRAISQQEIKDADILLVRSITKVDKSLLANTRVKFIGSVTAGADHLDTKWLDAAGINWSVAVGFNAPPVADYVVSVLAALQKTKCLPKHGIKAAVIGVGNVGKLVVERLEALGCEVVTCDPVRAHGEKGFITTPIEQLEELDLISVHVPLILGGDHATYHFIDKDFLRRQKRGCVLLNASRGAVINSAHLLEHGGHLQWCLDVWEHEPRIDKSILSHSVIATPHIAGYSVQSKIRGIDMIYRIACEQQIIVPQSRSPHPMPTQELKFAENKFSWQEIVLGVFNPALLGEMMRSELMPADDYGHLFDEMRNQFNYRHEFSHTKISGAKVSTQDKKLLKKLGLKL